jgi:effector-binding domain-containing protein
MKTLRKVFLWVIAIILVLIIIGFLLPKTYKVERNVYINADKSVVYGLVCNYDNWRLWAAWTKEMDSTVVFEHTGPPCQVGTQLKWDGKLLGNGEMTITNVQPGELFEYDLAFDHGKYKSKGQIILEQVGDSLKVTWNDGGDLGNNPFNRYFGLFMGKMMGPDFEKGLNKLKLVAEERNAWPKIEEKIIEEQTVILIRDSAGPATYNQVMAKGYTELMGFIQANKLKEKGKPFARYISWDSVTQFSVFDMGVPVENPPAGKGRIKTETIPQQNVVVAYYFGPYDKTAPTYYILDKYIREAGKEQVGGPWEIYITDPMAEKDTMKWETDIMFPVK